jgi:hypothetical protein
MLGCNCVVVWSSLNLCECSALLLQVLLHELRLESCFDLNHALRTVRFSNLADGGARACAISAMVCENGRLGWEERASVTIFVS